MSWKPIQASAPERLPDASSIRDFRCNPLPRAGPLAKMGLLRSEPMKHGTLVVPVERAREFIDLIGAELRNGVCSALVLVLLLP